MKIINKKLIKNNFYVTKYFLDTKKVLKINKVNNISLMQWKTNDRIEYISCGINEILLILRTHLSVEELQSLEIKYAPEGSLVKENQCVFSIKGDYRLFCIFENIIDSILARRCSVATNCYNILKYVTPNKIVFMSDRSDDYRLEPYDGYSAYIAGIKQFSNKSHIELIENKKDVKLFGSMPHALIHQFNGDIVQTFLAYKRVFKKNIVMLIDFNNDVIKELELLKPYFKDLIAVRLDTSIKLIDKSLQQKNIKDYGVNDQLVRLVRSYLDDNKGNHIKIICSSNNNLETIKVFNELKTPIDMYGIGSYLTHISLHFTADLVELNNKEFAKVGRYKLDESNLVLFKLV